VRPNHFITCPQDESAYYDVEYDEVLMTNETEAASEVTELLTEIRSNTRDVIPVPACPSCRTPGAFFKLYM
jgi:hypothetical protein